MTSSVMDTSVPGFYHRVAIANTATPRTITRAAVTKGPGELFGLDLFNSARPNHLALFHIGVVVEKVFDLKLVSILIFVTDRDRNLHFEYETLLAFVSIGFSSILLDIASQRWIMYKRFQIMGSNDRFILRSIYLLTNI